MIFDAAVYLVMFVAVLGGFHAGFVRSALTMFAYVVAMPLAVAATPYVTRFLAPLLGSKADTAVTPLAVGLAAPGARNSLIFFGVFLVIGAVLGMLMRGAVNETVGTRIGIADRLAGAGLGVIRIALVAVVLVLAFDRLIPAGREPDFLRGSRLRPTLSFAGQLGLRSLPPETMAFIDRLKKERGI
jgi:membrane protein required for colicin V production